jgi:hypothetical protein
MVSFVRRGFMKKQARVVAGIFGAMIAGALVYGQQSSNISSSTPAIRVTTRLVMVDVVATSTDGKPLTDLQAEDFTLEENGKQQKLSLFSAMPGQSPAAQGVGALPANVYPNRPEYHLPNGPLASLVIDGLNTSYGDQVSLPQHGSTMAPIEGSPASATGARGISPQGIAGAQALAVRNRQRFQDEQAISVLQARIALTLASVPLVLAEAGRVN